MQLKHKHLVLEQDLINKAKTYLNVRTDTDAVESALRLVVQEAELNRALAKSKGRLNIEKVFGD